MTSIRRLWFFAGGGFFFPAKAKNEASKLFSLTFPVENLCN
jgi:hypothetical protein